MKLDERAIDHVVIRRVDIATCKKEYQLVLYFEDNDKPITFSASYDDMSRLIMIIKNIIEERKDWMVLHSEES